MSTELPTYEEAQAMSLSPGNLCKEPDDIPSSPPPLWSPPRALIHSPSRDCSVTIYHEEPPNPNVQAFPNQPAIYQIIGRTSPNRVHRKK